MSKFDVKKQWWVVIVAIGILTLAFYQIAQQWFPNLMTLAGFLTLGLLGAGFCWVYALDKEKQWWALIPGLGLLIILVIALVAYFLGITTKDQWINVLELGVGTLIMGAVLKRKPAKQTLFIVSLFAFLVGILMCPLTILFKVILIVVEVLVTGYLAWRSRA